MKEQFLPKAQYLSGADIRAICLHHTAGGSAQSTWNWWNMTKDRIATHWLIDRDGTVIQCIPYDSWAYHLYVGSPGNKIAPQYKKSHYDKYVMGIELANWGQLTEKDGKLYNYVGTEFKGKNVCTLDKPYRGFKHWEAYTDKQIESLRTLLLTLSDKYKIPLMDSYEDIFDINQRALKLNRGIYSHTSFRTDKVDIFPQPSMLTMLNSLKTKS